MNPSINGLQNYVGKTIVFFQVTKEGNVVKPTIVRSVPNCKACDNESIRLVTSFPTMQAASKNGQKIDSYYSVSIPFNIEY